MSSSTQKHSVCAEQTPIYDGFALDFSAAFFFALFFSFGALFTIVAFHIFNLWNRGCFFGCLAYMSTTLSPCSSKFSSLSVSPFSLFVMHVWRQTHLFLFCWITFGNSKLNNRRLLFSSYVLRFMYSRSRIQIDPSKKNNEQSRWIGVFFAFYIE